MQRNHFLDFLKGILIIFIVVTHYKWTPQQRLDFLFPFWIEMAVPFFLLISGYFHALSYQKNNVECFSQAYRASSVLSKLVRYSVPVLIVIIVELYLIKRKLTFWQLLQCFLQGGYGPGSYYFPILYELIFVFPIIFFVIKKYSLFGLGLCGFLNLIFELFIWAFNVPQTVYRLLIFRYIFIIAGGCYLFLNHEKREKTFVSVVACMIGAIFIYISRYQGFAIPIINRDWAVTSYMGSLFLIPIAFFIIRNYDGIRRKALCSLEILGKASYDIFLVQMVYYSFFSKHLYKKNFGFPYDLLISVVICLTIGIVFFYVENPLTRKINSKVKEYTTRIENLNVIEKINKWAEG